MKLATQSEFTSIDPSAIPTKEVHQLLLGGVAPRPIALVSTVSENGIPNLAPFSFFNAFGANPPYVAFSPALSGKDGSAKDTLINVKATGECVIHAVSHEISEQVNLASTAFSSDINEIEKVGFTVLDSDVVRPQRIKESPFQMECVVDQIIELGGDKGSGNLVICKVVRFHVQDGLLKEGHIEPEDIQLIGRNGKMYYTQAFGASIFSIEKPTTIGMGVDQLPAHIRQSEILSANDLAKLGGLEELPAQEELVLFLTAVETISDRNYDQPENLDHLELFSLGYSLQYKSPDEGKIYIEQAASKALKKGKVSFAMKALMSIKLD